MKVRVVLDVLVACLLLLHVSLAARSSRRAPAMDGGCIVVLGEACAWGVLSMERHSVAVQKASSSALDVFP